MLLLYQQFSLSSLPNFGRPARPVPPVTSAETRQAAEAWSNQLHQLQAKHLLERRMFG